MQGTLQTEKLKAEKAFIHRFCYRQRCYREGLCTLDFKALEVQRLIN